jgi:DNA-binding GntR family transcriptional regulator
MDCLGVSRITVRRGARAMQTDGLVLKVPDAAMREMLDMHDGRPLLKIERLTYYAPNEPVDFEYRFVRTD